MAGARAPAVLRRGCAGSAVTAVGTAHAARPEYVEALEHSSAGNGTVLVTQFAVELRGLRAADGEEPPRILHLRRGRLDDDGSAGVENEGRWWRRHDGGDDDPDDLVPMDTQEQEELVRSLEAKQAQQSRRWRRVFAGFLLGYAAFLVYSSFHHAWSPWELRYHAYFMEDLPAPMVIIADWIAALACLFAVKGLLQNSGPSKKWMWYSCYIGILVAIFWTYYLLRLPIIRWDVAWLPLGPLMYGGLEFLLNILSATAHE
ncbi:unnamed protein product [Miscanthus lutarioriparius]|uniref:Uncharacterized protein n=1 Tax=Miscanthus lutarioriparius TaxID=422564 RepID=A0A811P2X2_9POAL|nr:unnamed protein product [Miscanthus lutarioriparius]